MQNKNRMANGVDRDGTFFRIYEAVKRIPRGSVTTYGRVAAMAGNPRMSRIVGYALHVNPAPGVIPCHRVVNREGRLAPAFAFGGPQVQEQLLRDEGVEVRDGFVDLDRYLWKEERPNADETDGKD